MGENMLAPDFLFCPTDTQLVNYYLRRKVLEKKFCSEAIAEVNIYKYAPWDLPDKSCISNGHLKWYFFCPVEKKYGSGMRLIRATEYGCWKVTGKDKPVYHNEKIVGMMKTLVFYQGKGSEGNQTDWVMHEYRLEDKDLDEKGIVQDAYVLCVVFQNGGSGARCKAPPTPREKDCIDVQAVSSTALNATAPFVPQSQCLGSSAELSYSDTLDMILDDTATSMESPQLSVDDILSMLDIFTEESGIDTPELIDDFSLLVNASELMEAPEYSLDNEGDDILSMSSNFIELDDIIPTSIETPQLSDDSILSMLANFTEESTMDSAEIDDLSLLVNASEFTEAFEVSHDDEAEDTLAMLSTNIEHDDVTPTSTEAPQLSDDSILSMLANFTEESTVDSAEIDDSLLLVNTSGFMEAPEVSPEDEAEDILSMLGTFIEHDDVTPTSIEASPPQLSAHNILSMPEIITEDSMIYFEQMEDELSSGC